MKSLAGIFILLVLIPALTLAAEPQVSGTTIIRFEERSLPGFDKQRLIPATQFIGIETDNIGAENLSLHLYGWGRLDLADKSGAERTTDGDLGYGYLQYRLPKANGLLKAGRFSIFEGVANEQIDGVAASVALAKGLGLSLYGGVPSSLDRSDSNQGDYIFGGRISYRYAGRFELGASALRENGLLNGTSLANKDYRQLVGGDLWASPISFIELNARVSYNTVTSGLAEQNWVLALKPFKQLTMSGEYRENRLKDYFSASNFRSLFNPDITDTVKLYGGSITWLIAKPVELTSTFQRISRDIRGDADRYGAELRLAFLENKLRPGASYFRVKGATGNTSYHETRGYILYDVSRYFTSLDAIAHIYDEKIYNKKNAFETIVSLGYRFMPNLSLSGDLSYGRNPQFDDELKGLVRLIYNYSLVRKGASK